MSRTFVLRLPAICPPGQFVAFIPSGSNSSFCASSTEFLTPGNRSGSAAIARSITPTRRLISRSPAVS